MRDAGMTQLSLASALHITNAAVYKWIKGKALPSPQKMLEISKLFGVNVRILADDTKSLPTQDDNSMNATSFNSQKIRDDFEKLMEIKNEISDSLSEFASLFDKRLSNIEKILKNKKF